MTDINTPKHKLGIAMQRMLQQGKKPCFRIDDLRITMASEFSRNPGHLYIKDSNWNYIGKVTPGGTLRVIHQDKITSEQMLLVLAAIVEPEDTAMSHGKTTGTCCCCGRTLTNKLSIELGIGPICRGFWFPESDEFSQICVTCKNTYTACTCTMFCPSVDTLESDLNLGQDDLIEKETELEETPIDTQICFKHPNVSIPGCPNCIQELSLSKEPLTSSLELDLGIPYKAVEHLASLPTPLSIVDNLVLSFRELNPDQKVSFITTVILEAVNSNDSN